MSLQINFMERITVTKKILEKIGIELFFSNKEKRTEDFGNGIQSKV